MFMERGPMDINDLDLGSIIALGISVFVIVSSIFFFNIRTNLTGFFLLGTETETLSIKGNFTGEESIDINVENVRSITINGVYKGKGYSYGYVMIDGEKKYIFDTRLEKAVLLTGMVVSNVSSFDENITLINSSTNNTEINNTEFNQSIEENEINETPLKEEEDRYNTTYNITTNTTEENTSIVLSLEDQCIDTCMFIGDKVDKIYIVVVNGTLYIDNLTISYLKEKNHPPEQIKPLENLYIKKNESISINLSQYFIDRDNDTLTYDSKSVNGLEIDIEDNIAMIKAIEKGSYLVYFYVMDPKEIIRSNEFNVVVLEINETLPNQTTPLNETINETGNITVNESFNMSVNNTQYNQTNQTSQILNQSINQSLNQTWSLEALKKIDKSLINKKGRVRVLIKTKNPQKVLKDINLASQVGAIDMFKKGKVGKYIFLEMNATSLNNLLNLGVDYIYEDKEFSLMVNETKYLVRAVDSWNVSSSGRPICLLDTGVDKGVVNYTLGYDFVNNDTDPMDDNGHGTEIAYIIRELSPNTSIVVVKVFDDRGIGYASTILQGMDFCRKYNATIMSMSFGQGSYSGYCDNDVIADECLDDSIICIAASGNDGANYMTAPACGSEVISVGAADKNDRIASFTNINNITTVLAPGSSINTKALNGIDVEVSGTSMAVPHVSAAVSLLLSYESVNKSELIERLMTTGKPILFNNITYGRIDFYNLLINNQTIEERFVNASQQNASNGTYQIKAPSSFCQNYCSNIQFEPDCSDVWYCGDADNLCHCDWNTKYNKCYAVESEDCSREDRACISGMSTTTHSCFECGDIIYNSMSLGKDLVCNGDFVRIGKDGLTVDCNNHWINGSTNLVYDDSFELNSERWTVSGNASRNSTAHYHSGSQAAYIGFPSIWTVGGFANAGIINQSIEETLVRNINDIEWWVYLDENASDGGCLFEVIVKSEEGRQIVYCYDNGYGDCPSTTSTSYTINLTVPSNDTWTSYSRNLFNDWVNANFSISDRINEIYIVSKAYATDFAPQEHYGQVLYFDDILINSKTRAIVNAGKGGTTVKECKFRGFETTIKEDMRHYRDKWTELLFSFSRRTGTAVLIDDYSGNKRNRTAGGDPTYVGSLTGSSNDALSFDGDDYVQLTDGSSTGFMHDAFSSRSVDFWFKPNNLTAQQTIYDEGGFANGFAIGIKDGYLRAAVRDSSTMYSVNTSINDYNWHHVAVTFGNSELKLYLDGELKDNVTTSFSQISSHADVGGLACTYDDDAFGNNGAGDVPWLYYNGSLDEFRILNKTLTADEVRHAAGIKQTSYEDIVIENSSVAFDYRGVVRNISIDGLNITLSTYGLNLYRGGSNSTTKNADINATNDMVWWYGSIKNYLLEDSILSGGPISLGSGGDNFTFLNVSFNESKLTWTSTGKLWVKWKARIRAMNGGGGVASTINATNNDGSESINEETSNGYTSLYNMTEYYRTSSGKTYFTPWKVNVSSDQTLNLYERELNITHSGTYEVYLFPCKGVLEFKKGSNSGPLLAIMDKYGYMWTNNTVQLVDSIPSCDGFALKFKEDISTCISRSNLFGILGKIHENQDSLSLTGSDFAIKNPEGKIVSKITEGSIYLTGFLYERPNGYGYYEDDCS